MKTENSKILKEIMRKKELEKNLPAYANAYINAVYEYSLIRMVLNYYTVKEVQDETGSVIKDDYLSKAMETIHTVLFKTLLAGDLPEDYNEIVEEIHALRESMMKQMTILTAYTDTLQIHEYVLNRIEYGVTGEHIDVEASELAAKVFRYLFKDNDKVVINSKIQMVTGQLPIRMTKNRFFDYLTDTLNIYKGSEKSSVDDFVAMLKSTAILELPEGYYEAYPEIVSFIKVLENASYKELDSAAYNALMEQFAMTTDHLTELVSNYLLVMEIVNNVYAALLALPYEKSEEKGTTACIAMLKGLHDAFITESDIPEVVDEGFMQIEGIQEMLGEDIMQYESILPDVMSLHEDLIGGMMLEKVYNSLSVISKLLSNSLFINLEEKETETELADSDYINQKRDELVAMLTEFFGKHTKEVNRAVMASLFSSMPVLFNSQQEIKDYIEYSLNHCSNESELMACASILEGLMEEE